MPSPGRLCVYGIGVAVAELAAAIGLVAGVGMQRVSVVLAVSALVTGIVAMALPGMLRPRGGGGGRGPAPQAPPEPPWWPEFERELRDWSRNREREPA